MVDINRKIGFALLITSLLLAGYFLPRIDTNISDKQTIVQSMPQYIQVNASKWPWARAWNAPPVILKIKVDNLPVGPDEMNVCEIAHRTITKESAIKIAEDHNFKLSNPPDTKDHHFEIPDPPETIDPIVFTEPTYRLEIYDTTVILYRTNEGWWYSGDDSNYFEDYVDINAAGTIAIKFIESHGGIPQDAKFGLISTETATTGTGIVVNTSYTFTFHHYIDNKYEVIGPGWENIGVTVNNTGHVIGFTKIWLSPYQHDCDAVEIHNAFEALQSLNSMPLPSGLSPPPASPPELETHEITSIELAYYKQGWFWTQERCIRPVWVFHLDGTTSDTGGVDSPNYLAVDAETLEQLHWYFI